MTLQNLAKFDTLVRSSDEKRECIAVFEIKVLFCAPLGCIHIETVRPGISSCTPLVYCNYKRVNKCSHIGRTCPKNVRPVAKMCAPGAECTVNFEHCIVRVLWFLSWFFRDICYPFLIESRAYIYIVVFITGFST